MARTHVRADRSFRCLALACALLAPLSAPADDPAWREVERTDGIVIEVAELDAERMALRLSLEVEVSPAAVRAVLLDFEHFPEWAGGLAEWRVLGRSGSEAAVYGRHAAPWPLADRDYVARYTWAERGGSFWLEARARATGEVPEVSGVQRLSHLHTVWEVSALPSGAAVVYTASSTPPAGLPRALVEWVWRLEAQRTFARLEAAARARVTPPAAVSAR